MRGWWIGAVMVLAACVGPGPQEVGGLRAMTVYLFDADLGRGDTKTIDYLTAHLPEIRATGFNAIFLPLIWANFDPKPLDAPRAYNDRAVDDLRAIMALLRQNHMRLLSGLNYIGEGWGPDLHGTPACAWQTTPAIYAAFEQHVAHLLGAVRDYPDVLVPFVFTESAEGCNRPWTDAPQIALELQKTLGSLPSRLPLDLRLLFRIGYHDYSIVALGWGNGASPIASPNPFDWVSSVAYDVATEAELDARAARFAALYPGKPLVIGELGSHGCGPNGGTEQKQADEVALAVSWSLRHGHGFSVWGWVPGGGNAGHECVDAAYGLAITNEDGSLRQAGQRVKVLLVP